VEDCMQTALTKKRRQIQRTNCQLLQRSSVPTASNLKKKYQNG